MAVAAATASSSVQQQFPFATSSRCRRLRSAPWSTVRRFARCGEHNPNHTHGEYTDYRRQLERDLRSATKAIAVRTAPAFALRIRHLPSHLQREAHDLLGWLTGEAAPEQWALANPKRSKPSQGHIEWYVPRRHWALAAQWLRAWRSLERLLTLVAEKRLFHHAPSVMRRMILGLLGIGDRKTAQERIESHNNDFRARAGAEVDRLRSWATRGGVAWSPLS